MDERKPRTGWNKEGDCEADEMIDDTTASPAFDIGFFS